MLWLLAAILAVYAMFLPVELTVHIRHHGQTQAWLTLRFLGLHKSRHFEGIAVVTAPMRRNPDSGLRLAWRNAATTRRYLRQHTKLTRLDALIQLHTGDAAQTALLTGMLRSMTAFIPRRHVHICLLPDFFRAHSTVQVRCIIRWKLGTLFLTAWMLLAETLSRQHLTESEAT